MKKYLLATLLLIAAALHAEPLLQPQDLVAICGDSITQQKIYSIYLEDYLLMCQPVAVRTLQFGANGAPAGNLWERTPRDLVLFHPTVVTTMYGMNDGQYQPLNDERAQAFRKNMTGAVEALQKIGVRTIIVGSPSCVDWPRNPDGTVMYNKTLASLGDISREIAEAHHAVFADVHGVMADAIAKARARFGPTFNVGGDGTHVGPSGHLMIAYAFLKAMGCDGNIGTITVNLAANTAQGTPGHKILAVKDGTVDVESTRYPFCFEGDPNNIAPTTAGILQSLPFNEDLNRFQLVVHGLKTARVKVTWGEQSREFAAADLEKGVNLAAAFVPENPFSAPFAKVDAAIRAQQAQETLLTYKFLAIATRLRTAIPSQTATIDQIQQDGFDEVQRLSQAAAAQVVPVKHSLTITPIP
ncbi:MAG TPA: GDSL-type esterase/lipase family protein [Armatimonadota bacterium]|jgi:lysophospholipase L1-like esterase